MIIPMMSVNWYIVLISSNAMEQQTVISVMKEHFATG